MKYDLFISHASEDKDIIVRPLAIALAAAGLEIWYDEFSLKLGDSLRQSIDDGLRGSKYGVVVLSKAFLGKQWPQWELDGLLQKHIETRTILPVWHGITAADVRAYSLSLANIKAVSADDGLLPVIEQILSVVKPMEDNSVLPHAAGAVNRYDNGSSEVRLSEHPRARIDGCYLQLAEVLNANSTTRVQSVLRSRPEMIFMLKPRYNPALVTNFRLNATITFDALTLCDMQWIEATFITLASVEDPPFDKSGKWSPSLISAVGVIATAQHWIKTNRDAFVRLIEDTIMTDQRLKSRFQRFQGSGGLSGERYLGPRFLIVSGRRKQLNEHGRQVLHESCRGVELMSYDRILSTAVNEYHCLELANPLSVASVLLGPGEEYVVSIDDWHLPDLRSEVATSVGPTPNDTSIQILSFRLTLEGEFDRGDYFYLVTDDSSEAWKMSYSLMECGFTLKRWFHASDWGVWIDLEPSQGSNRTVGKMMKLACRVCPKFPAKLFRFVIKAVTYRKRHSALTAWIDEMA